MNNQYITSEVINRKIIYYLANKNEIDAVKETNVIANIALALLGLCGGAAFSLYITLKTPSLDPITVAELSSYQTALTIATIFLAVIYIWFIIKNNNAIKSITSLGAYNPSESFMSGNFELKIVKASYFSVNAQIDVTEKLTNMIENNYLSGRANNETFGDPEIGKDKWLRIHYKINGEEFTKEYNQGEAFQLPPNQPMNH